MLFCVHGWFTKKDTAEREARCLGRRFTYPEMFIFMFILVINSSHVNVSNISMKNNCIIQKKRVVFFHIFKNRFLCL